MCFLFFVRQLIPFDVEKVKCDAFLQIGELGIWGDS
jgi:hypothetical protein